MIIDTLVVVVCLMVDTPRPVNRFDSLFHEANRVFNEAMVTALDKTKKEREKALSVCDMEAIVRELKRKTVKP